MLKIKVKNQWFIEIKPKTNKWSIIDLRNENNIATIERIAN